MSTSFSSQHLQRSVINSALKYHGEQAAKVMQDPTNVAKMGDVTFLNLIILGVSWRK